jgi:hypothetical protein
VGRGRRRTAVCLQYLCSASTVGVIADTWVGILVYHRMLCCLLLDSVVISAVISAVTGLLRGLVAWLGWLMIT